MKINENIISHLFKDADERISLNTKEGLIIEKTPEQCAEKIADAIVELVVETLKNADESKGKIEIPESCREIFGKLGKGTGITPGSFYEIDDQKLRIVLDYSEETYFPQFGLKKAFIKPLKKDKIYVNDGNEVSIDHLKEKLKQKGIVYDHEFFSATNRETLAATFFGMFGFTCVEGALFYIDVPRKKDDDYKINIKK